MDHAVQQSCRCLGAGRALVGGGDGQDRPQAEYVARRPDIVTRGLLGDMNPGEPITRPVCVGCVDSAAREMPKPMTRGPSSASSTFDGLRSGARRPRRGSRSGSPAGLLPV